MIEIRQIPTKTCAICGKLFSKPPNIYSRAWAKRKTCGIDCSCILRWNNRGRKPKPLCPTCGKPVPKPKMKYCSFACRTPRRTCAWCGKVGRITAGHKFCCWDCAVNASKTPVEIRICEYCGKRFEYKPNPITKGRFCSCSCGANYNQERGIVPSPLTEKQTAARIAGMRRSPISGPFATHHSAKDWFLISPTLQTFQIRNLKLFLRNRADLFSDKELQLPPSGNGSRAYNGLASIAPLQEGSRKRAVNGWHGWRWWLEGELRWQRAFIKATND